jgi:hypothetical protein
LWGCTDLFFFIADTTTCRPPLFPADPCTQSVLIVGDEEFIFREYTHGSELVLLSFGVGVSVDYVASCREDIVGNGVSKWGFATLRKVFDTNRSLWLTNKNYDLHANPPFIHDCLTSFILLRYQILAIFQYTAQSGWLSVYRVHL